MGSYRAPVGRADETGPGSGADKSAFVERLRMILAHWPSADRLARSMGVSPSAFRKWLKGEAEPSRERLVALARATGVRVAWLAEGEGPDPVFEATSGKSRRAGSRGNTGSTDWTQYVVLPGSDTAATDSGYLAVRHDWLRTLHGVDPDRLVQDIATGEAMAPTIRAGSALLIDTADRVFRNAGIYQLEVDHHRVTARVQRRHDGSLMLISDNPAYPPDLVSREAAGDLMVIGRVVWAGGTV